MARAQRRDLKVESPVEVAIESSDVTVAVVASVSHANVSYPVEVAVERSNVTVAIVRRAVADAVQCADIVVAARRTRIAEPIKGSDIPGTTVHVAEIPVCLRSTVAVAIAIAVAGAGVVIAVQIAVQGAYVAVSVAVAASHALREPESGLPRLYRVGANDKDGSQQLAAGQNGDRARCRFHDGHLEISLFTFGNRYVTARSGLAGGRYQGLGVRNVGAELVRSDPVGDVFTRRPS